MSPSGRRARRFAGTIPAAGLVILAAVFMGGCGDQSPPTRVAPPSPPPLQIASGSFLVTAGPPSGVNLCTSNSVYDGKIYQIVIDGTSFSMGTEWTVLDWWDASRSQGHAESERVRIGVRCVTSSWTAVTITFTSEDEFFGNIVQRRRTDGCGSPCTSNWQITGVRQ